MSDKAAYPVGTRLIHRLLPDSEYWYAGYKASKNTHHVLCGGGDGGTLSYSRERLDDFYTAVQDAEDAVTGKTTLLDWYYNVGTLLEDGDGTLYEYLGRATFTETHFLREAKSGRVISLSSDNHALRDLHPFVEPVKPDPPVVGEFYTTEAGTIYREVVQITDKFVITYAPAFREYGAMAYTLDEFADRFPIHDAWVEFD